MFTAISLILIGFILLTFGAEYAVQGSVAIANRLKVPTLIIGLTIVAFGTSAPEFVVSIEAALNGVEGIALGNIIGSNIANIALILGVTSLIYPVVSKQPLFSSDYIILAFATIVFSLFCLSGTIVMWHGLVFVLCMLAFIYFNYKDTKDSQETDTEETTSKFAKCSWLIILAVTLLGFAGIIYGSRVLVKGAVDLAIIFGVSETIIGLTIIAVGTSLPELATTVMAAIRKQNDVALGNIVGSNIWNILFIIGATGSFFDLRVPEQLIRYDIWVMLFVTALFFFFIWRTSSISRKNGFVFLFIYLIYMTTQVLIGKGMFLA